MSGTERPEPAGTDPIDLLLPRRSNSQRKRKNVNDTSDTFDRHKEFVARDSIQWRQGKFSFLEMVFLDRSACNQQTTL